MEKLLSIVTVCFNSEKTIRKCIESVIPQLSDEVEYLLIDGKSSDRTVEIINSLRNMECGLYPKKIMEYMMQ